MRIDDKATYKFIVSILATPDLPPAQEKSLTGGLPINDGAFRISQRKFVSLVSDRHAAEVRDILSECQLAVQLAARKRFIRFILSDQSPRQFIERFAIFLGPPVREISIAIILAAFIVKTMADLMTDHSPDATVVGRIIGLGIKEWRLQNRGRKHDLIHTGVVVRIHSLRSHAPLFTVDWFMQSIDLPKMLCSRGPHHVAQQIALRNFQLGIVSPFVRITNLSRDLAEFLQSLHLGRIRHPLQPVNALFKRLHQVANQLFHVAT